MLIQARNLLIGILLLSTQVGAQTAASREQILLNAAPSVVQIAGKDAEGRDIKPGSGFFVARRLVATSYSVVSKAVTIWLGSNSGAASPATLTAVNRARTLALLRVSEDRAVTLSIAASSTNDVARAAYAIAAPPSAAPKISEVVLDQHPDPAQPGLLRITRGIGLEFNGGPVLNQMGEVIGVAVVASGSSASHLIPATPIKGLPNLDTFLGEQPALDFGSSPGGIEGGVPVISATTAEEKSGKSVSATQLNIFRVKGEVIQGQALRRAEPFYPVLARAARVTGAVVVEITIDEEGNVLIAHALNGHPLLKSSAEAAAMGWLFNPTALNGTPVKVIGTVTFNFMM